VPTVLVMMRPERPGCARLAKYSNHQGARLDPEGPIQAGPEGTGFLLHSACYISPSDREFDLRSHDIPIGLGITSRSVSFRVDGEAPTAPIMAQNLTCISMMSKRRY